jgi:hypothetical protein
VLGDVEETIYVVDEEDDEEVKVGPSFSPAYSTNQLTHSRADGQQKV